MFIKVFSKLFMYFVCQYDFCSCSVGFRFFDVNVIQSYVVMVVDYGGSDLKKSVYCFVFVIQCFSGIRIKFRFVWINGDGVILVYS